MTGKEQGRLMETANAHLHDKFKKIQTAHRKVCSMRFQTAQPHPLPNPHPSPKLYPYPQPYPNSYPHPNPNPNPYPNRKPDPDPNPYPNPNPNPSPNPTLTLTLTLTITLTLMGSVMVGLTGRTLHYSLRFPSGAESYNKRYDSVSGMTA